MAVTELPPEGIAREAAIEALGDDFAQVSGQWLSGARVAAHLAKAKRVWAFAAPDMEAAERLLDALPIGPGLRAIGLLPGKPGWGAEDNPALCALIGGPVPEGWPVGLLLAIDVPDCANCPGCGDCGA